MEDNLLVEACLAGTNTINLHVQKIDNTILTATAGHEKNNLDLNQQLILNKASTFFVKMDGDAMAHAGIQHNDLLLVDKSIEPAEGKLILAKVYGKMVVCRYQRDQPSVQAWGVVTCVMHITDATLFANLFKINQVR